MFEVSKIQLSNAVNKSNFKAHFLTLNNTLILANGNELYSFLIVHAVRTYEGSYFYCLVPNFSTVHKYF